MRPERHAAEHEASLRRAMDSGRPPRGLVHLVRWYALGWDAEMPDELHGSGVWIGRQQVNPDGTPRWPRELTGGSALGSPNFADGFRRLLENSPYETDPDGYYLRPMRAAIARLAGRSDGTNSSFMARYLFAVACADFDWAGVSSRIGIPPQVAPIYTQTALERLWVRYRAAERTKAA